MHFYELHEGDEDTFFDVMLSREEEMDPEDFFAVVQNIRRRIQDSFEGDSLVEAIAEELEQDYGFVYISDDRLTAAVNVSKVDDDNFLADLEGEEGDDGDDAELDENPDYETIYADFKPDGSPPN
jgi:hypothetical protein